MQFLPLQSATSRKRRWTLAIWTVTLLALALRLDFVLNAAVENPIRGDAAQYASAAWNLVHHHILSIANPGSHDVRADSFRDPGYPLLLAVWVSILGDTGPWYGAVLITQAILGTLTIPLLLSALRPWPSERWLFGAGMLMAIWPHSVTTCGYVLAETLFGFLCALALFLLSRAIDKKSYAWLVGSGLCFGAAGLTNAVVIPFAPLLAIIMAMTRRSDKKFLTIFALSAMLLPAAWQLRGLHLPPGGQTASDRAVMNFVQGSWPEYYSSWRASKMGDLQGDIIQRKISDEYSLLRDKPFLGAQEISRRLASAPWHYLWWYASKPAYLWGWSIQMGQGNIYIYPTYHSPYDYNFALVAVVALCYVLNPMLALLAALGCIWTLGRRSSPSIAAAMAWLILYATLVYSLLQAEPRYAIPFRGVELALAISGLWHLIHGWRMTHRSPPFTSKPSETCAPLPPADCSNQPACSQAPSQR